MQLWTNTSSLDCNSWTIPSLPLGMELYILIFNNTIKKLSQNLLTLFWWCISFFSYQGSGNGGSGGGKTTLKKSCLLYKIVISRKSVKFPAKFCHNLVETNTTPWVLKSWALLEKETMMTGPWHDTRETHDWLQFREKSNSALQITVTPIPFVSKMTTHGR